MCQDSYIWNQLSNACIHVWLWLTHTRQDSFIQVPWPIYICANSYICAKSHSYMCQDSFIYVPQVIYICAMTHTHGISNRMRAFMHCYGNVHLAWLVHIWAMTHSYICATTHRHVPWLIHMESVIECVHLCVAMPNPHLSSLWGGYD